MKYFLITIFLFVNYIALGQMKVSGVVVDEEGLPLVGVIIMVKSKTTSKIISYGKTETKGLFSIEVEQDSYLEFSLLGFRKQMIEKIPKGKNLRIVMQETSIALKEVSIKADKVKQKGDTVKYNIGAYADSHDRSLGDVLAKIPGFSVEKETGKITYEGRDISNFYIEGLDMLGDKYGVATNTLPQIDVGTVEVIKRHQPIKVLKDFTSSDETAINIKLKENAKNRWVVSFNMGGGLGDGDALWKFDGLGLRLKKTFQTMLTYKTNNIGDNVRNETSSLVKFDDLNSPSNKYVSLAKPSATVLEEHRRLFNRNHALTVNTLKKFTNTSQFNFQLIYNNEHEIAGGDEETIFYSADGNKITFNHKNFKSRENAISTLMKYEKNLNTSYLKNSLSTDFSFRKEWLDEFGTNSNLQHTNMPQVEVKDNFYIIKRFGNNLISFYSNNTFFNKLPDLYVDTIQQNVKQLQFLTDNYATSSIRLGRFALGMKIGFMANIHSLMTSAKGLPELLGLTEGKSLFSSTTFYIEPTLLYKSRDINIELRSIAEYTYEKYSHDEGKHELLFSPSMHINWYATSQINLFLFGDITTEPLSPSRFYNTAILQDYQYVNIGYGGYNHSHTYKIRGGIKYDNVLNALHSSLSLSYSSTTLPYTITRRFVDDYIAISAEKQCSNSKSWLGLALFSKGLNLWRGLFNMTALLRRTNTLMIQNGEQMYYDIGQSALNASLDFTFGEQMHIIYATRFNQSQMKIKSIGTSSNISDWHHSLAIIVPVRTLIVKLSNDYYINELADGYRKHFLLTDIDVSRKYKAAKITLRVSNIFNRNKFSYVVSNDLTQMAFSNQIRGRNALLTVSYDL